MSLPLKSTNETEFHEKLSQVTLIHIWTHETKTVDVELVLKDEIFVFWPLAGTYRINLVRNEVRARSIKAQLRHKNIVPWIVQDIETVKRRVKIHLDGEDRKKEAEIRARLHERSMPGREGS